MSARRRACCERAGGAHPVEEWNVGSEAEPCAGCDRRGRRRFLGQLTGAAISALVLADVGADGAWAMPVAEQAGKAIAPNQISYPIPASDGASIDRDNQVILVRFQQKVYAFALACPHENTALRWRPQDSRFQCPRHESKYQPDGTFVEGRATRNMDRFALRKQGSEVVVDVAQVFRSDQQQAQWAAAVIGA